MTLQLDFAAAKSSAKSMTLRCKVIWDHDFEINNLQSPISPNMSSKPSLAKIWRKIDSNYEIKRWRGELISWLADFIGSEDENEQFWAGFCQRSLGIRSHWLFELSMIKNNFAAAKLSAKLSDETTLQMTLQTTLQLQSQVDFARKVIDFAMKRSDCGGIFCEIHL